MDWEPSAHDGNLCIPDRDRRITAITPAFQAGDVGSTPIGRLPYGIKYWLKCKILKNVDVINHVTSSVIQLKETLDIFNKIHCLGSDSISHRGWIIEIHVSFQMLFQYRILPLCIRHKRMCAVTG